MQQETVSLVICRCGWLSVAPCYGESVEMFEEHRGEEMDPNRSHDPYNVLGVAAPLQPEVVNHFKRQASVLAAESIAIDNHRRWKTAATNIPRYSMGDVNLGMFRCLWNILKLWAVAAVAVGCIYGLWVMR